MVGETALYALLRDLKPQLNPGEYVFCTLPDAQWPAGAEVLGSFREREGLTLILAREEAERLLLDYDYIAAWLTLEVHSALQAVGLTAAVARALAEAGISCNVVAGYFHDHLFVARHDGATALGVLERLSAQGRE